jgi:hypothetical protein
MKYSLFSDNQPTSNAMRRSSRLLLLSGLIAWMTIGSAEARQITGTVVDADGQPVSDATVFVDMTTLQTVSGADGRFELEAPPQYAFEVAAAASGHLASAALVNQDATSDITITLGAPIEATGEPLDGDMQDFFEIAAFSYTRSARDIEVENMDVLRHAFDEANNVVTIESNGPFSFSNPELGYRVTIHDFRMGGNAVAFGWDGFTLFEPMTSDRNKDIKNWNGAREDAWEGSRRHFFWALMAGEGELKDEEWAAWFVGGPGAAEDHSPIQEAELKGIYGEPMPILYEDDRPGVGRVDWAGWLRIQYFGNGGDGRWPEFIDRFWPVSDLSEVLAGEMNVTFVELPTYQAFVDKSGTLLPSDRPATNELGYWTFHRLADMLPYDWQPE